MHLASRKEDIMIKLLEKAELKIQEEIERVGYIDDSDGVDRYLDNLAEELAEELAKEGEIEELKEEVLQEIKDKIMTKYNKFYTCHENAEYRGFYTDKKFNNLDEFEEYFKVDGGSDNKCAKKLEAELLLSDMLSLDLLHLTSRWIF